MIRVLVLAGSPVSRAGLESMLRARRGIQPVGPAAAGQDESSFAEMVRHARADVVLVEADAGEDAASWDLFEAEADPPGAPVVLLAAEPEAHWSLHAVRLGLRGVLPRDAASDEIVAAVEAAAAGLVALRAESAESVLSAPPPDGPAQPSTSSLSPREIEVLRLLAQGLANKEIAARLDISAHTVKFHVASIFAKLGAASRADAVARGIRRGLVPL